MSEKEMKIIVIGGGPGGYVADIEASQDGVNVTLKAKYAGGETCVKGACIPNETLMQTPKRL